MGLVSFIVNAADESLATIAQSQFSAIASGLGTSIMLMSTLAVILLFVNMALQIRPMDGATLFPILIKIGLINAFAVNWVHFNFVSGLIISGIDNVAGAIIGSMSGETGAGATYFAARFDQLNNDLADYANQIGANMNWMAGAMMSVLLTVLLAILGGAAALILVLSKMVITLLIGIAPVMIALTLFRATQDYFNRWLSALIGWSLYPIVIAGVFSIIFGLLRLLQGAVGETGNVTNIGSAIPFLAMIFLSLVLISFIPGIARTLSGDLNSGLAGSAVGAIGRRAYSARSFPSRGTPANRNEQAAQPRSLPPAPSQNNGAKTLARKERSERLRHRK